jgi:hypothetical protein
MDGFGSFAGVIALWLGVSCGLWWLHRRSLHAGQRRQLRQAVAAVAYVAEGQTIFDGIRRATASAHPAAAGLIAQTHALLKRMQDRSGFFDKVTLLRIEMLAAFGVEDYPPLSELLHIRRDLWAASEIVLVEDLSSFAESFAEAGAYDRLRAEAAALLFKTSRPGIGEEDVIDLRLSLARGEAERFVPELKDAIRLARERDRLPTFAEIVAYPIGAIRALPGRLLVARAFLLEFYRYATEIAGAIGRSEAMERGVSELRRAREELPQRLVTGLERASGAARQSASGLRRHYDFLVAAHDFQAKYELALRRTPRITERGRQFIARLELAERSERLRLTWANLLIWLTRRLATGLAYGIAGLQRLHAELSDTPPGALAAAVVAPTQVRGRHPPAFRSYRMALGASGLTEPRPQWPPMAGTVPMATGRRAGEFAAKAVTAADKGKHPKGPAKPAEPAVAAKIKQPSSEAIKPAASRGPDEADISVGGASANSVPSAATPAEHSIAMQPAVFDKKHPVTKESPKASKRGAKRAAKQTASLGQSVAPMLGAGVPAVSQESARHGPIAAKGSAAEHRAPITAPPPPSGTPAVEPRPASQPPEARRSFLARLFGRRPPEPTIGELLAEAWEREHAAEAPSEAAEPAPAETAPRLLAKLSDLPGDHQPEGVEDEGARDEPVDEDEAGDESAEDAESLTSSVLEVQARFAPKPPQIRSFPWLRG